ncbi:hypothetical protein [Evansella halocellulosilytica]|uniref:hypothetical protein n=1 Tax=Evansella halocellulosilytica TaxID=2011013 RepID=UPI000BB708C7|nr:hypothetical protein [Evansella halocellulosilytica]
MQGLLENPLILFFIIAAILSFFQGLGGNKKQENKRPNRPQNRPAETGQSHREEEVDWREIFKQETQTVEERRETTRQPSAENSSPLSRDGEKELNKTNEELLERYENLKKRKQEAKRNASKIENSPIQNSDLTKNRKSKVELDFSSISRDEAVKGIIWSEILGKPRSRKPRETFSYRK